MNSRKQSYVIYALLAVAVVALLIYSINSQENNESKLSINEVAAQIQAGNVEKIIEDASILKLTMTDGSQRESTKEPVATTGRAIVTAWRHAPTDERRKCQNRNQIPQ